MKKSTSLRSAAEAAWKKRSEASRSGNKADQPELQQELEVQQIELEMQNEELEAARAATEAALERYADFFDYSLVGYCDLAVDGTIRLLNLTGAKLLGLERSRLIGKRFSPLVAVGDRPAFNTFLEQVFATATRQFCEVELPKAGRPPLTLRLEGALAPDGEACRMAVLDVSEARHAQEALKLSERRFRRLFESAKDGILMLNAETGMVEDVNPFLIDLLGHPREHFLNKKVWELGCFKDLVANEARFSALQAQGYIRYDDMPLECRDGRRIEVEFVSNVYQENGHNVMQCNIRDISERKRADAEIEAISRFPLENPNPVLRISAKGLLEFANPAADTFCRLIGAKVGGRVNREWKAHVERTLAGKVSNYIEFGADGTTFGINLTPVVGRNYVNVYADDITKRREAEANLRESENRFRLALMNSPYPMMLHAEDEAVLQISDAWCEISGFSREELATIGDWTECAYGDRAENIRSRIRKVFGRKKEKRVGDQTIRTKSGEMRIWEFSSEPVGRLADGRQIAVTVAKDVTDRRKAEAELKETKAFLQAAMDNSEAGIAIADAPSGRLRYVNRAGLRIHGGPEADAIDSVDVNAYVAKWKLLDLDGRPLPTEEVPLARAVRLGVSSSREFIIRRSKNDDRVVLANAAPIRDNDGKITAGIVVFIDVTTRKEAEQALIESEQRLALAMQSAKLGIWDWDVEDNSMRWDARMYELYGIREEEFSGAFDAWEQGLHPEDRLRAIAESTAALEGSGEFHSQFRVVWPNGEVRHLEAHGTVLRSQDGSATRMIGLNWDVTEKKRIEESHSRLAMAVEQSDESILITDMQGIILYANPAFERCTGYTSEEVIGRKPNILRSGQHDPEFYRQMWESLAQGQRWSGHLVNRRKDGTLYEEEATISPVRDASGKTVNYVAVKRDVTREMQLEAQFRQSQKMDSIGQLAGGIAHDFNNILGAIMMQTDLVGMVKGTPADAMEGLVGIRTSAERAANLTRQLLLFSRKQVMQPRLLDLNESVTGIAKMLQRMIRENISLQLHLHHAPLSIIADPGMLDQVFINLAVNARDAMPGGGWLRIETSEVTVDEDQSEQIPDSAPGRYACIDLSDNGSGIPQEVLPKIFDPFFTTKEVGKGTGLGLATVFGIVKQHGGWVTVTSEVGKGTSFRVFLPENQDPSEKADYENTKPKPRGGSETILVVEDDPSVRLLTRLTLERSGYHVIEAADGVEAHRIWSENHESVALLFTDLVMPGGVDGYELAARLQADRPGLRVILTSGYSEEFAGRALQLLPGQRFIQKPCSPEHLLEAVRNSLDGVESK